MQKKKCRKVGNCMETINELLKRIMELAYEKSTNTNADIFVGYYPHVELVDVRLYLDGWQMNREPDEALGVYFDEEENIQNLEEIIKRLESIGEIDEKVHKND